MFKKNEFIVIILSIIILAFSNSFINSELFLKSLLFFTIILFVYITSKKLTAYYYESEQEIKIWSFQRFGYYKRSYFKNPIPIGIILPFLLSFMFLGQVIWFAVTQSETKPTKSRAVKKHQTSSYSEMSEWHIAVINCWGFISLILLFLIAYIINQPQLAKLSIYFAVFNLLPLGKLDGTKLLFGSKVLYFIIFVLTIIFLLASLSL